MWTGRPAQACAGNYMCRPAQACAGLHTASMQGCFFYVYKFMCDIYVFTLWEVVRNINIDTWREDLCVQVYVWHLCVHTLGSCPQHHHCYMREGLCVTFMCTSLCVTFMCSHFGKLSATSRLTHNGVFMCDIYVYKFMCDIYVFTLWEVVRNINIDT